MRFCNFCIYICLILGWVVLLSACTTLSYYRQAIHGHLEIISHREPIDAIVADDNRDPELINQLVLASDIRDFASEELDLPDNGSYRSYVDVGREYVTWVVYAAPEFSLGLKHWCFPFAGCVPYRGYFSKAEAMNFAQQLRQQGLDVYIGGVTAYSTLGWFDDPMLNTMISRGEISMAGVVFHELTHQRLYIPDDTAFNEAFATAVQEEGVRRWLQKNNSKETLTAFEKSLRRKDDFYELINRTREELEGLYSSDRDMPSKRTAKQEIIDHMRQRYQILKLEWDGYSGYDQWFNDSINNAKLASVALYREQVPDFVRILAECGGDFRRFYEHVKLFAKLNQTTRHKRLRIPGDCTENL